MTFFDDIYVPLTFLPTPSALYVSPSHSHNTQPPHNFFYFAKLKKQISDPNERSHFWLPSYTPPESDPDHVPSQHELLDSPISERMYIDTGEILRVRVEADEFFDDEPGPPKATDGVMITKTERRRPPYSITVSLKILILFFSLYLSRLSALPYPPPFPD